MMNAPDAGTPATDSATQVVDGHERPAGRGPRPSRTRRVVADVMTRAVVTAHEAAVFKEIVDALARNRISAVPVIDSQRRVIGVVSESDLLARVASDRPASPPVYSFSSLGENLRQPRPATARELMTSPAVTTTPDTTITAAARIAEQAGVRRLPVVDETGALMGIVTRGDLIKVFLRDDNDIRRDIEQLLLEPGMALSPQAINVTVTEGVVTLSGQLDGKLLTVRLTNAVQAINGVVDTENQLTYRVDDDYRPAWPIL